MSFSVGCIMDSKYSAAKTYGAKIKQTVLFGLPMTADILAEVVCNGFSSGDSQVSHISISIHFFDMLEQHQVCVYII